MAGEKSPRSLYTQATWAVVKNFKRLNAGWQCCPNEIVFDIFFELHQRQRFDLLARELKQCQIFSRLLKARLLRHSHKCYTFTFGDYHLAHISIKGGSQEDGAAQGCSNCAGGGEQVRVQHAEGEADAHLEEGEQDVHAEAERQVDAQLAQEDGRQCGVAEAHGEQDQAEQLVETSA